MLNDLPNLEILFIFIEPSGFVLKSIGPSAKGLRKILRELL